MCWDHLIEAEEQATRRPSATAPVPPAPQIFRRLVSAATEELPEDEAIPAPL